MAEQAAKQEQGKAVQERPQVRLIKLGGEVFLPDGVGLRGANGVTEIDLEHPRAAAHRPVAEVGRAGVVLRYQGVRGQKTEARALLIPWHMITRLDVAPEWKP